MIWIILIGIGGFILVLKSANSMPATPAPTNPGIIFSSLSGLPDIDPLSAYGGIDSTHDTAFITANQKYGIPFALLKAHAMRESNLDSEALRIEPTGRASYGLMQILWWPGSSRFSSWGYTDDQIGDGSLLYDEIINLDIAGHLISENFSTCQGNLRDTINMYNTGVKESVRVAPHNYVDDVLKNYSTIIGRQVIA